jgi:HlyD family secretion protein
MVAFSALLLGAAACNRETTPDAYGNVEAAEVVVSSEASGPVVTLTVEEGQQLSAGQVVGTVDSIALALQQRQIAAQRDGSLSRVQEIDRQIDALTAQRAAAEAERDAARGQRRVLDTQLEIAHRHHERIERLFADQATTAQQRDIAERDDRVLQDQVTTQDQHIEAQERLMTAASRQIDAARQQRHTTRAQVAAADAQVAQIDDRIHRSTITNPSAGTVLTTYARRGEIVAPGQPLYKIADLSTVDVRAYVSEPQLSAVTVGGQAQVTYDRGGSRPALTGTISWVSRQAEFTPTPIQTRDERANLVYAVKIRVPNPDGVLKIGMPVDIELTR